MTVFSGFNGKWACAHEFTSQQPEKENTALNNLHMLIRKQWSVTNRFSKAVIRITADDYYKLHINGQFVGQGPAPGYHFAYYYNEYDITSFIKIGKNEIFADVYYQGLINRVWNSGDGRQGIIADIIIDGDCICSTDETWDYTIDKSYTSNRITGYDTQFLEDRDSRIKPSGWRAVCVINHDCTFCPQPAKSLEVYSISPAQVKRIDNGWFYDFGKEITGGLSISVIGKSGQRLGIRCGEECTPDGRVRYEMRCNCNYEERWILDEGESSINQYDYKAFRYAEILSEDGSDFEVTKMECFVRHYPFPSSACNIQTSDEVLQQVFDLCKETVKYGSQEVFVDCPTREKGQYAGDALITGSSHMWLTGDPSLLRKAIDNMAQSLCLADGMLAVAPCSFYQEIADYSLQFPLIVWRYYCYTLDTSFLRDMLAPCESIIEFFARYRRFDGMLEKVDGKWNLVDWPDNLRDGYDFPLTEPIGGGCHNVINAFYVGAVKTVEQIKETLKLPHEHESDTLTAVFNKCFYKTNPGFYTDSESSDHASLHSNCIPVFYGLHPPGSEESLGRLLREKGMSCGVYMAFFYLKALSSLGFYDAVYSLITSDSEHSWYNMIREGATTCFEAWGKAQKWNTSLCHPWAGAPIPVLIEDLIGLSRDAKTGKWLFDSHLPTDGFSLKLDIPIMGKSLHFCS